jgi:hypothetical protein
MNQQPFKSNQLQHALAISQWMQTHSAQGGLDPRNMLMEISLGEITQRFYPQFTVETSTGHSVFVAMLQPGVNGFVGWYPFTPKAWPIAQSKLEFKNFAQRIKLRTPAWTHNIQDVKGAFLIKRHISSFGLGQRGPFVAPPGSSPQAQYTLEEGEYCEQFIMGQMLKAWFWCDQLVVVELVDMPFVQGDGKSSVVELLRQSSGISDLEPSAELLALQGADGQSVLAKGERMRVAYQFLSEANPALYADYNCRGRIRGTALEAQLSQAGQLCWNEVPAAQREGGCITSLDGMLDAQGKVWFLEANCNPRLHPAFYDHMLNAIFKVTSVTS